MGAMDPFSCLEAKKIVAALAISRGTQGDGADGARVHPVVVDLVGLGVFSKFESGMEPVVDSFSRDDGTGADTLGDPERMGERVEPKNSHEDHFDDHPRGERVEREDIVGTAGPFLDGPYAPFDRGDMFILTTDVQVRVETVSDISAEALEFAVAVDRVETETATTVHGVGLGQSEEESSCGPAVQLLGRDEVDVPRDRHEKRYVVHIHDVDAKVNVLIS